MATAAAAYHKEPVVDAKRVRLVILSSSLVARTGDPFAGLWYTIGVVAMALVVTLIWLPETAGRDLRVMDRA